MLYCKKINLDNHNDSLTQIYNFIPAEATVLDIGCATGSLAFPLVKNKNCKLIGLDFNPESISACKKLKIFDEIFLYDMNNFNLKDFEKYIGYFDYIVCADILEHLVFPEKILNKIIPLLKNNGYIIISLPNIAHASIKANLLLDDFTYTEMGILDKTHLHFYTYKNIAKMLTNCNLKIVQADTVTLPVNGWQPHKITELPEKIREFITSDKHSHIMQYVMLCQTTSKSTDHNLKILDSLRLKSNISNNIIYSVKRFLMLRTPNLIKYLEKIKK